MIDDKFIEYKEPVSAFKTNVNDYDDETDSFQSFSPTDENDKVWYSFLLFGIGAMLPWSVVCNQFVFLNQEMSGYHLKPDTTYPFAINGLLIVA
jgi:hypothetical protein